MVQALPGSPVTDSWPRALAAADPAVVPVTYPG
jgi:hypothetical protein